MIKLDTESPVPVEAKVEWQRLLEEQRTKLGMTGTYRMTRTMNFVGKRMVAELLRTRLALNAAQFFFDSPSSFSDEEFRSVYAGAGQAVAYKGSVPHLKERCEAEAALGEARQLLLDYQDSQDWQDRYRDWLRRNVR